MNPSDDVIRSHGLPRHPSPRVRVLDRQVQRFAVVALHNLWWGQPWMPWTHLTLAQERDLGLHPDPSASPDATVAAIGLPSHPTPNVIADRLRGLADELNKAAKTLTTNGLKGIRAAEVLAARGWPSGTLGDGGPSNGASFLVIDTENEDDPTSEDGERIPATRTEIAAVNEDRWNDADRRLAQHLQDTFNDAGDLWRTIGRASSLIADVLAHASDDDELPAGTGSCEACTKVCRPTAKDPNNRLRSGLCNACRMHWARSGITDRGDWLLTRRALLGHREGAEALAARFTLALEAGEIGETA